MSAEVTFVYTVAIQLIAVRPFETIPLRKAENVRNFVRILGLYAYAMIENGIDHQWPTKTKAEANFSM